MSMKPVAIDMRATKILSNALPNLMSDVPFMKAVCLPAGIMGLSSRCTLLCSNRSPCPSGPQMLHVDIDPGVDIVEQIPARMIRVVVDHEIVAAVPTPVLAQRPVPKRYFKGGIGEPESPTMEVDPGNRVPEGRTNVRKAAIAVRLLHAETRVIGLFTTEPLIVIDVWKVVHVTCGQMFGLALFTWISCRVRCLRNSAMVGARPILNGSRRPLRPPTTSLSGPAMLLCCRRSGLEEHRESDENCGNKHR